MNISVVIPAQHAENYLPALLMSVERQSYPPREIVIVDSSSDEKTASVVEKWCGSIPVVYHRTGFACPGRARNLGVELSSYEWIAFLDCRTIPYEAWLKESVAVASREDSDFVGALLECSADSFFKKSFQAATYGYAPVRSLPGSLVRREFFRSLPGFIPDARAGEDIEWLARVAASNVRIARVGLPVLRYEGFPSTLAAAIRKWHLYTVANARIDVRNSQKVIYGSLLVLSSILLAYKWNHLFAHWNEASIFYIPNITKIVIVLLFAVYLLFRGLVRPWKKGTPLSFLMPCRWLVVFWVGLCLDLAKAPGMILGAFILFRRYLKGLLGLQGQRQPSQE